MSRGGFRGRGGDRGGRGGGFGGGRGGGGGGGGSFGRTGYPAPSGPPDTVLEMGTFLHSCEGELVVLSTNPKIPYFNAPIYLENKSVIGKVDEILGPMNQVYFTVKPQDGIVAASFKQGDKVFIGGDKLLPLERFLPKPKVVGPRGPKSAGGRGGGGGARGGRGGRGGAPRGRGGFTPRGRGGPRGGGGFTPRGGGFSRGGGDRGGRGRGGFTPRGRGRGY